MSRRLAAIVAVDMVGYSRLMAADEAGTLARQRRYRKDVIDPAVAACGGRIVKTTGDGLLLEFSSVVDAFRCAVNVQLAITERETPEVADRRIAYRMGVNLGDVVVEDGDIYGDGVNIAARLEALADPGGICVSRTVVSHVRGRVASDFDDLGPQALKNLPEPVHVYRVLMRAEASAGAPPARRPGQTRRVLLASCIAAAIALAGGSIVLFPWFADRAARDRGAPAPDAMVADASASGGSASPVDAARISLAILPFENVSGSPEHEYLSDGMTEDLITNLSKLPELLVISRNSTFRFKGQNVDPRVIGEQLDVRYLMTGSVRRRNDTIRISSQLVDTRTGGYVWAERYDGLASDVFALQDEVTDQIARALALNLDTDASRTVRAGETADPQAYDLVLRGWEHLRKRTPEHQARALDYFTRAIARDPGYGRAHAAIAAVYWAAYRGEWPYGLFPMYPHVRRAKAIEHLELAMQDPSPLAYQIRSRINVYRGRWERGLADVEEAVRLDPNDADSWTALAEALIFLGRPEDALGPIEKAQLLDPYNRSYHSFLRGLTMFGQDRFEEAADLMKRALDLGSEEWSQRTDFFPRGALHPLFPLAAALAHLGREIEAAQAVTEITKIWEFANVQSVTYFWPYRHEADRQRLAAGLRTAKLPEW